MVSTVWTAQEMMHNEINSHDGLAWLVASVVAMPTGIKLTPFFWGVAEKGRRGIFGFGKFRSSD